MTEKLSDAIKLYGTEESVEPMHRMTAGPLSCDFDQGALRFIKVHGKEAIRNIAFVVRDKDWGTYQPALSNLCVEQQNGTFLITFDAICKDDQQQIRYKARITGDANGTLSFTADYTTVTDFLTNRTGFVVLHPVQGVSGHPVTVEKVDGDIEKSSFPELVDPVQPFMDIRALTHEVVPGVTVCCRMSGDTFEMEDHRQWNDASYKTYVRPIGLPWPYTIPAAESHQQAITLTIDNEAAKTGNHASDLSDEHCVVTINTADRSSRMPGIGLGLEPQHLTDAFVHQDLLKNLAVQQLVVWHELDKHSSDDLKQAGELARNINTDFVLHAVIPDADYKSEIAELAERCRAANLTMAAICISPAMYLRSIMPGTNWPDVTSLAALYDEVRSQFPGVTQGGGMLSFFPELNRHRPPTDHLDYITHASNTITHACDDITVTENLEALPYIIKTCRSFSDGKPYHVGPSSIGMRFNPYGSKTMDNPDNARIAMARMDPRQRGLVNAAWSVGYVAHLARGDVDQVNLHAPTGEFGIIYHPQQWQQPGFDDTNRTVYPAYHAVAGFAQASGKTRLATHSSMSREIEAIAYEDDAKHVVWIANLTSDVRTVEIKGLTDDHVDHATLCLETFDDCTEGAIGFDRTASQGKLHALEIGPYSVVRITASVN